MHIRKQGITWRMTYLAIQINIFSFQTIFCTGLTLC
uniref:Uncharacterized protein n=1 Tax=Anguilla anguilla TaxID=7936 RepID=A0A0E9W6T7_ANGAN